MCEKTEINFERWASKIHANGFWELGTEFYYKLLDVLEMYYHVRWA